MPDIEGDRPKARIVGIGTPQARLIKLNVNEDRPRARIVTRDSSSGIVVPNDPQLFAEWTRQHLGVDKNYGFDQLDILGMVDHLGYHPSAFLFEAKHWRLVLAKNERSFTTYDPTKGVIDVPFGMTQVVHLAQAVNDHSRLEGWYWKNLDEMGYKLDEEHLRPLGPTQNTLADCGPLAIYAAGIAHGKIPRKTK